MAFTTSPNMNLIIPTVGSEPGPTYASDINSSLTTIDGHSHTPGSGVAITPAAININSTLQFNGNSLSGVQGITLTAQPSLPTNATIYVIGVDLYYNDGSGNIIRITQSGSVTGSTGTITGLPSGTASASYSAGVFTFSASTNTPANIVGASFVFGNSIANTKTLTLAPPSSLGANYTLVLPLIPATPSYLTIDTSGNLVGSIPVAVNYQISPSSDTFTTSTGTFVPVTNLSVTITTLGGPVIIMLQPDSSLNPSNISNTGAPFDLAIFRGATQINRYRTGAGEYPPSAYSFLDNPGAGTYTYSVQALVLGGSLSVFQVALVAYEL